MILYICCMNLSLFIYLQDPFDDEAQQLRRQQHLQVRCWSDTFMTLY
jgi:hypothetical protein